MQTMHILSHSNLCWLILFFIQVTNNYSTSSFAIKASDVIATLDNGIYSCQVTLTISEVNTFNETSNNSTIVFKGLATTKSYC